MSTQSKVCTCGARDSRHTDACAFRGLYLQRVNAVIGYALIATNGDQTETYLTLLGALMRFAGRIGGSTELIDAAVGALAIAREKVANKKPPPPAPDPAEELAGSSELAEVMAAPGVKDQVPS